MNATILLCDFAEAVNGKLYIMGGGWDRAMKIQPISCSVAIMLSVPWQAANAKHVLRLTLQDEDGELVKDPDGNDVDVGGEFETGRPPGVKPGSDLRTPLAIRMQGMDLEVGGYAFVLEIDGTEITRAVFNVDPPPQLIPGMPGAVQ